MAKDTRVVITGLGVISPIGIGKNIFWTHLISGQCGIGDITSFDCSGYKMKHGCEVKSFTLNEDSHADPYVRMGRSSQFAIAATAMAIEDSGIDIDGINSKHVGISIGTAGGEILVGEHIYDKIYQGSGRLTEVKKVFAQFPCEVILANIVHKFGIQGECSIFPTACSAGNYAIGHAYDLIRSGRMSVMIAGGVESFSKIAFTGFCRLNLVSPDVCRPFDKNRKGLILGEGAGIMILEGLENAKKRNAVIYGEILGYGISCDGYHVTAPEPSGYGMIHAMKEALTNAKTALDQVNYINAHGTGTIANDKIESLAIRSLFKNHADSIAISSIKSMIGHTLGAASAIEAITCALSVRHDIIPPTIHYETKDAACDLDYVPNVMREKIVNVSVNNAFAFGGNNTSLVIAKYT
jgi:3-oxoacyl-[acyl-carrier-protein] synthase II